MLRRFPFPSASSQSDPLVTVEIFLCRLGGGVGGRRQSEHVSLMTSMGISKFEEPCAHISSSLAYSPESCFESGIFLTLGLGRGGVAMLVVLVTLLIFTLTPSKEQVSVPCLLFTKSSSITEYTSSPSPCSTGALLLYTTSSNLAK